MLIFKIYILLMTIIVILMAIREIRYNKNLTMVSLIMNITMLMGGIIFLVYFAFFYKF